MAQAVAIRDATDPDEVLFVVDAMIGQDAVATAQAFLDGVGYDGVVLTKLDGDARGGAALSIAALTGKPVMFASTGEKLSDFDIFHPDRMATRILDMGDVLTLIEQAEKAFDADQAASMANRLMAGEGFTLEDFIEQLGMLRKLGPLKNILGMMPGASKNKELLDQVNDKDLDRAEAIVRSMTPAERRNPKIINGSRRLRIANGSGVTVGEVSQLVTNFFEGQRQMKMLMGGGMPGMPGIPGMMGGAQGGGEGQGGQEREGQAQERRPAQGRAHPGARPQEPGCCRRRRGAAVDGGAGRDAARRAGGRRRRRASATRARASPAYVAARRPCPRPSAAGAAPTSSRPHSASATKRRSSRLPVRYRIAKRGSPRVIENTRCGGTAVRPRNAIVASVISMSAVAGLAGPVYTAQAATLKVDKCSVHVNIAHPVAGQIETLTVTSTAPKTTVQVKIKYKTVSHIWKFTTPASTKTTYRFGVGDPTKNYRVTLSGTVTAVSEGGRDRGHVLDELRA